MSDSKELNISKTLLPRRADTATMKTYKAGIVLSKGEIFLEYPNSGPGTKGNYYFKIGDGVTPYKDLPYAFGVIGENFVAFTDITINNKGETELKKFEDYMEDIRSGITLEDIISYLKAAITVFNNEFNDHIEDDLIHVSKEDRISWTTVGTPVKAVGSLNDLKTPGTRYYADSGNNCTDKPNDNKVDGFGMEVFLTSTGHLCQELTEDNVNPGRKWIRIFNGNTWGPWSQVYSSSDPPGSVDKAGNAQNDILDQRIDTTYIKNIRQNMSLKIEDLDHPGDKERKVTHNFTVSKGNNSTEKFEFEDENTQYQMHVKNDSNDDGDVNIELTSTDSTSNAITFKGDAKGSRVTSEGDVVKVSTEYSISVEPHYLNNGERNGVDIVLTDINGNKNKIVLRSIDETRVTAANGKEINFYIPNCAIERLQKVPDQEAMYKLTRDDVQNGDSVLNLATKIMYIVVDDDNLDNADGYTEYSAHRATELTNPRKIDGVEFDGSSDVIHYGYCSTAASTATKAVTCVGFNAVNGARIHVKFANSDTSIASTKLNVNGTGAKPITMGGEAIRKAIIQPGCIYEFVYTGSDYELVSGGRCTYFDGGEEK